MDTQGRPWPALVAGWVVVAVLFQWFAHRPGPELEGCRANLERLGVALELYSLDHGGTRSAPTYPAALADLAPEYLESIPTCPSARFDTYSRGYRLEGEGFVLACPGRHHSRAGKGPDEPRYDWRSGLQE